MLRFGESEKRRKNGRRDHWRGMAHAEPKKSQNCRNISARLEGEPLRVRDFVAESAIASYIVWRGGRLQLPALGLARASQQQISWRSDFTWKLRLTSPSLRCVFRSFSMTSSSSSAASLP